MFVFEFLMGSLAFVYRKGLGHQLELELKDGLKRHYNKTETVQNSLVNIWDHLQSEVKRFLNKLGKSEQFTVTFDKYLL